jgi:hypothetical protein
MSTDAWAPEGEYKAEVWVLENFLPVVSATK